MILSGWKDIAQYLNCGVRTVQRWETEGLPVHRPTPSKRGHVIAHSEELDRWIRCGGGSGPGYPALSASINHAQRLHGVTQARLAELQAKVLTLRDGLAELRARRSRNLLTPITKLREMDEVAG